MFISIPGLIISLYCRIFNKHDSILKPIYGCYVSIWTTLFI